MMSGSSTHGARALGHTSIELGPRMVSIRGDVANANAATRHATSDRTPSARATVAAPTKATHMTSAIQSRWTTQPGRSSSGPRAKKGPIGHR